MEKYMDGIIRTLGDESKAVQMLQMTRDKEMWQSMVVNVCRGTALLLDTDISLYLFISHLWPRTTKDNGKEQLIC